MAYTELSGSKLKAKLGAQLNESAAVPMTKDKQSFAMRQMSKMGWSEGDGLGKNREGMKTHIRVKKREEEQGIGQEKVRIAEGQNTWWADGLEGTLFKVREKKRLEKEARKARKKEKKDKKKKKKKKKGSSGEDVSEAEGGGDDNSEVEVGISDEAIMKKFRPAGLVDDEVLFNATGGARFGMRQGARAEGKWSRAEGERIMEEERIAREKIEWEGVGEARVIDKVGETIKKRKREKKDGGRDKGEDETKREKKDGGRDKGEGETKKEKKEKKKKKEKIREIR